MTNIDISPARMPDATVFQSSTARRTRPISCASSMATTMAATIARPASTAEVAKGRLHRLHRQRRAGLFRAEAQWTHVTADQFTKSDFSGWVDGKATVTKAPAAWEEALPNLYLGGTGTSYHEPWQGDLRRGHRVRPCSDRCRAHAGRGLCREEVRRDHREVTERNFHHRDTETQRYTAQARSARPQPKIALGPLAPRRDAPTTQIERPRGEGMQGEWGTADPRISWELRSFREQSRPHSPFIPSPRADQFRKVAGQGARGEGTGRPAVCGEEIFAWREETES